MDLNAFYMHKIYVEEYTKAGNFICPMAGEPGG